MDEVERRRAAELLREIRETRTENHGGSETKLTWMYKGPNDMIDLEEYLLGKAIDKTFEGNKNGDNSEIIGRIHEPSNVPKKLLVKPESSDQVDTAKKILEDPLYAIKQKELEARRKLLDNPVKLKELKKMIIERNNKKLERKKQKKMKLKDLLNDEKALNKKILKKLRILSESHRRKLLEEAAQSSDSSSESDAKKGKKSARKRKAESKESSGSCSKSNSSSESEDSRRRKKQKRKLDVNVKKKTATKEVKFPYHERDYKTDRKHDTERVDKRKSSVSKNTDKRKSKRKSERSSTSGSSSSSSSSETDLGSQSDSSSSGTSSSEKGRSGKSKKRDKIKKDKKYKDLSERRSRFNEKDSKNTDSVVKARKTLHSDKEKKKDRRDYTKDRYHSGSLPRSDKNQNDKRNDRRYREDFHSKVRDRSESRNVSNRDSKLNKYDRSYKERSRNESSNSKNLSEKDRERKLREMMEDAKVRKEEREKNLARHRKIQSEEEKQEDYDDGFMRRQISHATSKSTVADRIRSNVNNIQRSKDDTDSSFLRK